MKKFLLLSAVALAASVANAGVTDVTPKAYNFDSGLDIPFLNAYSNSEWDHKPWNPSAYFLSKYPDLYNNGLVLMIGPGINANWDSFINGTKVVDLGGEVGKVLCFGGINSNAQDALKARGIEVALPYYETNPGYMIPFWHADPEIDNSKVGDVENACRVQIVLNIFENEYIKDTDNGPEPVGTHFQPYIQMGANWQPNDDNLAPDRAVFSKEFCYNWGEAEADNHRIDFSTASADDLALWNVEEGDGEFDEALATRPGYVWNPNRWLVYEWDVPFGGLSDDGVSHDCPIKIKMEMPELNGATVFIKSIKFLQKDSDEESIEPQTRRRTWKYMDVSTAAIANVIADAKALNVNVAGNAVTFNEKAEVYAVSGVKVAVAEAGQQIQLANGFYVATANGKSVKFAVK